MHAIQAKDYQVVFNEEGQATLNALIEERNYSRVFVLVDTNTHEHCLARFMSNLTTALPLEVIEIDAGEEHKDLKTCMGVWEALSELDCDRKGLIINVGGGVVTDLGGFVACCFKRGIDYINVPTSLLAMVDASVGGKTGVDLGSLKNQIGVIGDPQLVLVDTWFLGTLPMAELRSGYAEMLKHGLIADQGYWEELKERIPEDLDELDRYIHKSITIKNEVVLQDPREDGVRKTLNFGHTLGHAIESYFMEKDGKKRLLHGEAIAIGMILATYLSTEYSGFPEKYRDAITTVFLRFYKKTSFKTDDIKAIIELLKYDKKNSHGIVYFVLLKKIGQPVIDQKIENDMIVKAFDYYENFKKNFG